ncbi:hypothetical protein C6P45_004306 [Maudiozyma exigua]|uniref:Uncharacterized protein n=1 Tax=Maudiozyma exigua TaxID=34358 RepID=A0A9P7B9Y5_MAUEX|nr:hypothetical protein C6P45_004306 [Kazachstania exigua]
MFKLLTKSTNLSFRNDTNITKKESISSDSKKSQKPYFTKIKLRKLKDNSTIKFKPNSNNDDSILEIPNFYYDAANFRDNPEIDQIKFTKKNKGGYSINLYIPIESKKIYMADLNFINKPSQYCSSNDIRIDLCNEHDGEETVSLPTSLKGFIIIDVFETISEPIVINSINIFFKCFVTELIMQGNPELGSARYSSSISFNMFDNKTYLKMLPIQSLQINLLENISSPIVLQKTGKMKLPFTFIIHPNIFPSQLNTMWGKTFFRIEAQLMKTSPCRNYSEMTLLSQNIQFHRILSNEYDMGLLKDTIFHRGTFKMPRFDYQICLDSRIIEINSHFNMSIELLLFQKKFPFDNITIFLVQTIAIPHSGIEYNKYDTISNKKPECFIFKNEKRLYSGQVKCDTNMKGKKKTNTIKRIYKDIGTFNIGEIGTIPINDIKISDYNEYLKTNSFIHPFYCERSTKFSNIARIKISHNLSVRFEFRKIGSTQTYRIFHKIPICLINGKILENMHVPVYTDK